MLKYVNTFIESLTVSDCYSMMTFLGLSHRENLFHPPFPPNTLRNNFLNILFVSKNGYYFIF